MAAQWGFRLLSHPNGTKPSVDPTDATGAPQQSVYDPDRLSSLAVASQCSTVEHWDSGQPCRTGERRAGIGGPG
jgi:hypothetical protein